MTDDGLYTHGYFGFTYYSGEGRNKFGCIPNMVLRRALLQLDEDVPDEYMNTGASHYEDNRDIWHTLLLGNGKPY